MTPVSEKVHFSKQSKKTFKRTTCVKGDGNESLAEISNSGICTSRSLDSRNSGRAPVHGARARRSSQEGPQLLIGLDDDRQDNAALQAGAATNQSLNRTDIVIGGSANDVMFGLNGNDVMDGGPGSDIILGGPDGGTPPGGPPNSDIMFGGQGNDINLWAPGDGSEAFIGGSGSRDALVFGSTDRETVRGSGNRCSAANAPARRSRIPPGHTDSERQWCDQFLHDRRQSIARVSASRAIPGRNRKPDRHRAGQWGRAGVLQRPRRRRDHVRRSDRSVSVLRRRLASGSRASQPACRTNDSIVVTVPEHQMNATTLIRLGGLAAIVAGVLRTAASFWPSSQPGVGLEMLYLVIDLCILFGIMGVYAFQCEQSGRWGVVGFLLAVSGTAFVTGPDGRLGGVNVYDAGALVLGTGLCFLAIGSWRARKFPVDSNTLGVLDSNRDCRGFGRIAERAVGCFRRGLRCRVCRSRRDRLVSGCLKRRRVEGRRRAVHPLTHALQRPGRQLMHRFLAVSVEATCSPPQLQEER